MRVILWLKPNLRDFVIFSSDVLVQNILEFIPGMYLHDLPSSKKNPRGS